MLDTVNFTFLSIWILLPSFKESRTLRWQAVKVFEDQIEAVEPCYLALLEWS